MSERDFYKRYLSGEREQVWDELVQLGSSIRDQSLFMDALDTTHETMSRVLHNISTVIDRLKKVDYIFKHGVECSLVPPNSNALQQVSLLEQFVGILPLSIRVWYEVVGAVDLIGPSSSDKQQHKSSSDKSFYQLTADPLFVAQVGSLFHPALGTFSLFHPYPVEAQRVIDDRIRTLSGFSIYISEDAPSKVDTSGGGVVLISVPSAGNDAVIYEEGYWNDLFVKYIRFSFEWGGFPGFANVPEELRPTEMLDHLREGLLPI